jgi:hypothetical protein
LNLGIDLGTNSQRQDYKIGSVRGILVEEGKVNEGDETEGIWLMDLTYIYEIE